jgi:3-methyladenine DNA glycosylase AlkD
MERLDVDVEVIAISLELEQRRDPLYEAGLRRTVPSAQPAHFARVPEVRKVAEKWRRDHRDVGIEDLYELCDLLWQTGWREERQVAVHLLKRSSTALAGLEWDRIEGWSDDIDNWEMVDHLAGVSGALLLADASLLPQVVALADKSNPWQRRLAVVTLIVAFTRDGAWRNELESTASRLANDSHPLVRRAVVWARDRLKKGHVGG